MRQRLVKVNANCAIDPNTVESVRRSSFYGQEYVSILLRSGLEVVSGHGLDETIAMLNRGAK
jgi:hypothetical protein